MMLFELPENEVVVGLRVLDRGLGRRGTVSYIDPDPLDGLDLTISWDDGKETVERQSKLHVVVESKSM